MTREEAKRRIEFCRNFLANNYSDMGEPNFTAFNMAIEALQQQEEYITKMDEVRRAYDNISKVEPCEDAISRQAVLSMQYRIDDSATLSTRDVVNVDDIKVLPLVNPQPKTGHWIKHDNGAWWECSKCHAERAYGNEYCPDCGSHNGDIAKMIEPQESEDKE